MRQRRIRLESACHLATIETRQLDIHEDQIWSLGRSRRQGRLAVPGLDTTRIYTKIDLHGLRQVAEIDLGALL